MLRPLAWIFMAAWAAGAAQAPPDGPGCGGPGPWGPPPPRMESGPGSMRQGPEAHRGPEEPQGPPMLRFLALSEPQQQAVRAIQEKHRPAQQTLRRALDARSLALKQGVEDPALGETQLRALQAAESEARLQLVLEQRAEFLERHAILTKDQQARAERMRLALQKEREAHLAFQAEWEVPAPR